MRYSLLGGGKRVRATLTYATANMIDCNLATVDPTAAAVEIIHAYSLIHDDLPAMDDDDLRRGKPSCHIAFGEATAVLAGDALQSLAFETLTHPCADLSGDQRCEMVAELAIAIGAAGMAAGQTIDLAASQLGLDLNALEQMHRLKTGALIQASCRLAAIAGGADKNTHQALDAYSANLGLCFQICDDILDVTASTDQLGKPSGSDDGRQMPTYVTLLGLNGAHAAAEHCSELALDSLTQFGPEADLLRELVKYQQQRTH
ncbi:MAG: geranyl transferase [Gammaproteobacteria bacterium]|nr:MAG: geranyl transferase [Gammaproteobacteria bacterium]RLA12015.1 MAG: geranyl transferase [Gammaproteobacteria bacterium]RLA16842.1 MAG: geranyl transferase [Gammaproteobacteria bacterium]